MNDSILFWNPGTLDLNFIRLMGVSVKEGNSAIGFFGTGLKYAIANVLRHKGSIRIVSDGVSYDFKTQLLNLRGKDFEQITMNDELLPFTTELGKHWEPWMAIRELYSNALDEAGDMICCSSELKCKMGVTQIYISGDSFIQAYNSRQQYFIAKEERPIYSTPYADVYAHLDSKLNTAFFYKGIRVGDFNSASKYRYNIKDKIDLTEDRTCRWSFQVREAIEKAIISSTNEDFIRSCLVAASHCAEANLPFGDQYSLITPSSEFTSVVERLAVQRPKGFNSAAMRWNDRRSSKKRSYTEIEPTKVQKIQIERSLACLRKMGYEAEVDLYPLKITTMLGEGVMGQALDGVMWLSTEAFTQGTKYVCSTILEEFVHVKFGYKDYTLELQTWLFDKIISLAEDHVLGGPL